MKYLPFAELCTVHKPLQIAYSSLVILVMFHMLQMQKLFVLQVRNATSMAVSASRIYVAGSNGVKVFSRNKLQLVSTLPSPRESLPMTSSVQMSPRISAQWEPQPSATSLTVTTDGMVCVRYADQRLVCWQETSDGSWQMLWQRLGAAGPPSAAALCAVQSDRKSLLTLATASADGQVCEDHLCRSIETHCLVCILIAHLSIARPPCMLNTPARCTVVSK